MEGTRFRFGRNWQDFLEDLKPEQVEAAERSLTETLGELDGLTFLDAGCGSGLFSLAARQLGAKVTAFDYDPDSVEAARSLGIPAERGDVTDTDYMRRLGTFDVVYSWGVIHHTGSMWTALENLCEAVNAGGRLVVSVYNDQDYKSRRWRRVKRAYNERPWLRPFLLAGSWLVLERRNLVYAPRSLFQRGGRGMSRWHDLVDWTGGYPFEVAKPEAVFGFCHERGFALEGLLTRELGCNEFVFRRSRGTSR